MVDLIYKCTIVITSVFALIEQQREDWNIMGHRGRPRRRNEVNQGVSQHISQPQPVKQVIKEEPTNSLHDESDLISFRNDGLTRLTQNQELLESVTSKYVHTDKIIPPAVFPEHPKRLKKLANSELSAYIKAMGPEGVYFGDRDIMEYVKDTSAQTIEQLKSTEVKDILGADYEAKKNATQRMRQLLCNFNYESSVDSLDQEFQNLVKDINDKVQMKLSNIHTYKQYSIKNMNVEEAPKDYNPRLINAMVNLNKPSLHKEHAMAIDDKNNSFEFANNFLFQQNNKNLEDINHLFQRQDNQNVQQDIVDEMGDLINFQGDGDIINGGAFDDDFLSQIDHSLE